MPYKSEKQRKFMHAKHPEIASKWDKEYGGKIMPDDKKKKAAKKAAKKVVGAVKKMEKKGKGKY